MKRISALLLVAGLGLAFSPPILALGNRVRQQDQQQGQQPAIKTFTGRIAKYGPKFVLEDSSVRTAYQLDDQQKAEKYQGKNVRVIGTLDAENNMIHVRAIEEAV
jgi:hypothetical protein